MNKQIKPTVAEQLAELDKARRWFRALPKEKKAIAWRRLRRSRVRVPDNTNQLVYIWRHYSDLDPILHLEKSGQLRLPGILWE
jgi:hypothetical protein